MLSLIAPRSKYEAPSLPHQLLATPLTLLATSLYSLLSHLRPWPRPPSAASAIRIICISDTHTQTSARIPDGDLLIHAGDLGKAGTVAEIQAQIDWLNALPHKHKVVIAGNHDTFLDPRSRRTLTAKQKVKEDGQEQLDWRDLRYLQHSTATLSFPDHGGRQLKLYGAPQIPACGGPEFAFQYERDMDAWSETVPNKVDILVTHTPPLGHLDLPVGLGCKWLLREIWRVRPRLHVFGHVHAGYGMTKVHWDGSQAAYEKIRKRSRGSALSFFNPLNWLDLGLIVAHGVIGLLWSRLWGGWSPCTIMVNAALMSPRTGNIDQEPQIVDL